MGMRKGKNREKNGTGDSDYAPAASASVPTYVNTCINVYVSHHGSSSKAYMTSKTLYSRLPRSCHVDPCAFVAAIPAQSQLPYLS